MTTIANMTTIASGTYIVSNVDFPSHLTTSFVCDLCFEDCDTLYDAKGFQNLKNVCESCSYYVEQEQKHPGFAVAVDDLITDMDKAFAQGFYRFPCFVPNCPLAWFYIRFPRHFTYDYKKYDLIYRCRIAIFMKCITQYVVQPALQIGIEIEVTRKGKDATELLLETLCTALNASLIKIPQGGSFIMTPAGDFKKELNIDFPNGEQPHRGGIRMLHGHTNFKDLLGFGVYGWGVKPASIPNDQFQETYHLNQFARCECISFGGTTLEWTDPVSEEFRKKHAIKEAKKEKERKEQEKKEKKQRQREEQRQLDLERKAEQDALRQARATLVDAVAKIDEELEKIRKLRELNREVALTNKKIFERKETEKLAKEAERRHAEKLKQKELERQRFISKKL